MNFINYQQKSRATAKYPAMGHGVIYPAPWDRPNRFNIELVF